MPKTQKTESVPDLVEKEFIPSGVKIKEILDKIMRDGDAEQANDSIVWEDYQPKRLGGFLARLSVSLGDNTLYVKDSVLSKREKSFVDEKFSHDGKEGKYEVYTNK